MHINDVYEIIIFSGDCILLFGKSTIRSYHIVRNRKVDDMFHHEDTIFELRTVNNRHANKLISCSYDNTIVTWDLEELKKLYVIDLKENRLNNVTCVTWSNK